MSKKVTMQDIADETGYSRNTVSKALNGSPSVPEGTRDIITAKAAEMGYKQFLQMPPAAGPGGSIALFTHSMPGTSHFGSRFISSFTEHISRQGFTLTIYMLQAPDVGNGQLPANFSVADNAGILCIELFDREYSRFLCSLGVPTLFADAYVHQGFEALPSDLIMMENRSSVHTLTRAMAQNGARHIGFVGDKQHCLSFSQRFEGYRDALEAAGLPDEAGICILDDDSNPYGSASWLCERLSGMEKLPDGFVCANDYIAISLVGALKRMELSVPGDVMVAGFDDAPEAKVLEPKLTTVAIPGIDMGTIGACMMLNRIQNPNLPFQANYVGTTIKYRESVRGAV